MKVLQFVDNIELYQSLGKGNYGEVFLSKKKGLPQFLATKKMDKKLYQNPQFFKRLYNELNIIMMVKHPNIVKYEDFKISQNNFYLVTEYINGGSLKSNLIRYMSIYRKPFSEEIVQYLMRQIVDVVKYLHFNNIIHRDLKLDNVLVNYPSEYDRQKVNLLSCQIKLIDFGFATILKNNQKLAFTVLGTPNNMDPKILAVINNEGPNMGYNEKVDIWSLGTLCYEMVVGCSPFTGSTMPELYQNVQNGKYILPLTLSEEIVSFIKSMLQEDDNKRADAKSLKNHPFLINPINSFHHVNVNNIQASYLPGGLIRMQTKPKQIENNYYNPNNQYNIWTIFNQQNKANRGAYSTNQPTQNQFQFQNKPRVQQPGVYSQYPPNQNFQY